MAVARTQRSCTVVKGHYTSACLSVANQGTACPRQNAQGCCAGLHACLGVYMGRNVAWNRRMRKLRRGGGEPLQMML